MPSSSCFLLHVLPSGFVRIRQFGFLANRIRKQKLIHCRALLVASQPPIPSDSDENTTSVEDPHACPICKLGRLVVIELLSAHLMIGSTYSVPDACIGSAQSLSRSLSLVDRVPAERSPATHRRRLFSRWQRRLVPTPFHEFYPKRSGPTLAASISAIPPEHSG
jgi:hypothetical protein